ncbi:hypothetical protein D3C76_1506830 [compost metagenome]
MHQHMGAAAANAQAVEHRHAVELRNIQVEHDRIGLELERQAQRVHAVVALADDVVTFAAQNHRDRHAYYSVVIDQQHFHGSALMSCFSIVPQRHGAARA